MNSFFLTDNFSGDIMADYPFLGAQYHKDKTVFRVQSEHAAGMELCLFSPDEKEEIRIKMNKGDDNVWTAEVPAVKPGQKYGYRAYGEYDPSRGLFFNPAKLAVDPYGFEVSKTMDEWTSPLLDIENSHDSAPVMPKSVVVDMKRIFDPEKYPHLQKRPSFPIAKDIIYETHIKNFSHLNTMLPREKRGKLSGLGDSWTLNYFKRLGVNNIELMPIAPTCCGRQIQKREGRTDSWGYNPYCFFAVDPRYGNWEDFAAAVSELHKAGIGVILDWVPAHFPRDSYGLSAFDGTCLYEHQDPRQGSHPHWGTLIYNYGRPQVSNYLIANALFWVEKYHADGIRMDAVASMLYLDYGRQDGEWIPNMYGGNENLEAIELIKHFNSILKKRDPGVLSIAEESTAFPMITGSLEEGGLGFDLKWNMGFMNDYLDYIKYDPYFRSHHHGELTFSMIYAYSEKFMLVFSHDEVVHGKGTLLGKMPGDRAQKLANLRLTYGYMMTHPGKKLLFMGQDLAEEKEWNEMRQVEWQLEEQKENAGVQKLVKDLNVLYRENKALYECDDQAKGFQWMNEISANECYVSFVRKGEEAEELLLVVANFSGVPREITTGVPYEGKYKEILNTDAVQYGGTGVVNDRVKRAEDVEWDDKKQSVTVKMAPLSLSILQFIPYTEAELEKVIEKRIRKNTPIRKTAGKTTKRKQEK